MKKNMEDIDKLIRETLTEEEAKFYDDLEEKNILGTLAEIFTGKNSWIAIVMNIVNLAVFAFFIYCIVQVLNTENTNKIIQWTALGFLSLNMMGMIKLYTWMQVDKNAIIKEIKRIELLVSSISHKMSE